MTKNWQKIKNYSDIHLEKQKEKNANSQHSNYIDSIFLIDELLVEYQKNFILIGNNKSWLKIVISLQS